MPSRAKLAPGRRRQAAGSEAPAGLPTELTDKVARLGLERIEGEFADRRKLRFATRGLVVGAPVGSQDGFNCCSLERAVLLRRYTM